MELKVDTRLARRVEFDLSRAVEMMDRGEVSFAVHRYYNIQEYRKALWNQAVASGRNHEPHSLIMNLFFEMQELENMIKKAMDLFTERYPAGRWAKSIFGIGPVLSAGLLAEIDPEKCRKVASVWRFAGLDPTLQWEKGKKRPYNADLKVLAWKIGESFVRNHRREKCWYGHRYLERKAYEWARNLNGELADQALERAEKVGKNTEAYKWYSGQYAGVEFRDGKPVPVPAEGGKGIPMLPPAHIDMRARRWTVKLFLAHFAWVYYETESGVPMPDPYAVAHLGHVEIIPPPNYTPIKKV